MNTFTTDAIYGKPNPKTAVIEMKTRKHMADIAQQFIRDCINNDIAMCSAEGFFYDLVFQSLTEARVKVTGDLKNKKFKVGDRVYFIDHYANDEQTDRIIEATVTEKRSSILTVEGKNGNYKNALVEMEKDDLFMTAELAMNELEKHS